MKRFYRTVSYIILAALLFVCLTNLPVSADQETVIANGIYLGGQHLGGMTASEAKAYMKKYMEDLSDSAFTLVFGEPVDTDPDIDEDDEDPTDPGDPSDPGAGSTESEPQTEASTAQESEESSDVDPTGEQPTEPEEPEYKYSFEIPLKDFGLEWDVDASIQNASTIGQSGKLIERYKLLQDLKADQVELPISYTFDEEAIRTFVEQTAETLYVEPVNAEIHQIEEAEFSVVDEINGQKVNVDDTVAAIVKALEEKLDASVQAVGALELEKPLIRAKALKKIDACLGVYRTNFDPTSNRGQNIIKACYILNGTILMPGESIAIDHTLDPTGAYSSKDGWLKDDVYVGGQVVLGSGGGVCQIATTMYNAVLYAELEVLSRYNHSMMVGYVDPSRDATLATGSKELQFRNNLDYPVYIEGRIDEEIGLVFAIYGKESRDPARTIDFISDTTSAGLYWTERIDNYTYDPNVNFTDQTMKSRLVSGSHHPDIRSSLTKVVYMNGVEVERIGISVDRYVGDTATYYIGTKDLLKNDAGHPLELDGSEVFDGREYDDNYILLKDVIRSVDDIPYQNDDNYYMLLTDYCLTEKPENGDAELVQDKLGRYVLLEEVKLKDGTKLSEIDSRFVVLEDIVTEENKVVMKEDGTFLMMSEVKLDSNGKPMKHEDGTYVMADEPDPEDPTP